MASAFLTTDEASDRTRIPKETLRYWRYIGVGPPSFRLGRRVLYDAAKLEAWLEEQAAKSAASS